MHAIIFVMVFYYSRVGESTEEIYKAYKKRFQEIILWMFSSVENINSNF